MYIIVGGVLLFLTFIWCCLKAASDADDEMGYDDGSH